MDSTQIYQKVQERYSSAAKGPVGVKEQHIAESFGYSADELASIPDEANLGLSCGNAIAIANLDKGEIVVDFGSGAGFDVFLAAKKVGEFGVVIGIDHNQDMIEKAETNRMKVQASKVRFVKCPITQVAVPDGTVDCVISNCVINLVPEAEKPTVFREAYRVLKPGGRVAISDILARKELPSHIKQNMALYVGCIAGASQPQQYEQWLREAGFSNIVITDAAKDLNVYTADGSSNCGDCCLSGCEKCCPNGCENYVSADTPKDFNEWAGSFKISARKE